MELTQKTYNDHLLISASGRLDASWAEYFTDMLLSHIRQGHHKLIVDAANMPFLSSAGIRALVRIHKELRSVEGTMQIINATDFVANTLITTGFESWLTTINPIEDNQQTTLATEADVPDVPDVPNVPDVPDPDPAFQTYLLNNQAGLTCSAPTNWEPWQVLQQASAVMKRFSAGEFALGIGKTAEQAETSGTGYGEFLVVDGHVIYQPPSEKLRPDYLLAEEKYLPELLTIQAVVCQGAMTALLRFNADDQWPFITIDILTDKILAHCGSQAAGFVILAETGGLVGATLIQSPDKRTGVATIGFPEIRNWLSFTGEPAHTGQLALMFGYVKKPLSNTANGQQAESSDQPTNNPQAISLSSHIHAAVFPYQPLKNGLIEMSPTIRKILDGPPPLSLMHLIDDTRPVTGLGQSKLIRGACWFSPINNPEAIA
jgi:anti-anti-sigma factor